MDDLYSSWIKAKDAERVAVEVRREIEDELVRRIELATDAEGSTSFEDAGYAIKVVSRIDRKVDGDALQELAAEHGLDHHLGTLFRWKPEINMTAWRAADDAITRPLASAITAKPGRPSFSITKKD